MSVHKWRAFIGPYERVSVIHRFPPKQEPNGEVPASLSASINQRLTNQLKPLPSASRKIYNMQNIAFSLLRVLTLWDNKNRNSFMYSINDYGALRIHRGGSGGTNK